MQKALKEAVRAKASQYGSLIIYAKDGELIEEDPQTKIIRIVKKEYSI